MRKSEKGAGYFPTLNSFIPERFTPWKLLTSFRNTPEKMDVCGAQAPHTSIFSGIFRPGLSARVERNKRIQSLL